MIVQVLVTSLVVTIPALLWAYISQRRLTRKLIEVRDKAHGLLIRLIEAERVRDNYRKGLSDECAVHALLIGRTRRAVEILSHPDDIDDPIGDVIDLLHSAESFADAVGRLVIEYLAENVHATLGGAIFHVCNELHCGFEIVEAEWHRQIGDEPSQGKEQQV